MSANQTPPTSGRDADHWARPVEKLQVSKLPDGAINVAVAGRQLTGPIRGFGQLWQKTYRLKMIAPRTRMSGEPATPRDVIKAWKENFGSFWPRGNRFYSSLTQITPGDVAVLNLAGPVGMPLSTGVMVIYADDESFAFMTPQGHIFAGLITFSADQNDGDTSAQVQFLIRASDPIFELFFRLGLISKMEDRFWETTLLNLAEHLSSTGKVYLDVHLIDPRVQWSEAKNIFQNAAMYTMIYVVTAPFRWLGRKLKRK